MVLKGWRTDDFSRTWRRYTRTFRYGYDAVKVETWRAANAEASRTDANNAFSYEITFADSDAGIVRAMNGQVIESLDENGLFTRNDYDISRYFVTCTSRKYFVGSATNNQQPTTH